MRKYLIFVVALLASCHGTHVVHGERMFISFDRPEFPSWTIDSNNANAAFVTSADYLSDGRVSRPTRMTWDVGAQTTNSWVKVTSTISPTVFTTESFLVAAAFMPKTDYAVPEGVLIEMLVNGVSVDSIRSRLRNDGSVVWFALQPFAGVSTPATSVALRIWNSQSIGGSTPATWATSGQTIDVGEIWFGTLQEFRSATDPEYGLVDPTTNRRSHDNTNQPLFRKPYRTFTTDLLAMRDSSAYLDSTVLSFDAIRYGLSQASAALIIPRYQRPGTADPTTIDYDEIAQLAIFGRVESIGPLRGLANTGRWVSRLEFSEQPP